MIFYGNNTLPGSPQPSPERWPSKYHPRLKKSKVNCGGGGVPRVPKTLTSGMVYVFLLRLRSATSESKPVVDPQPQAMADLKTSIWTLPLCYLTLKAQNHKSEGTGTVPRRTVRYRHGTIPYRHCTNAASASYCTDTVPCQTVPTPYHIVTIDPYRVTPHRHQYQTYQHRNIPYGHLIVPAAYRHRTIPYPQCTMNDSVPTPYHTIPCYPIPNRTISC